MKYAAWLYLVGFTVLAFVLQHTIPGFTEMFWLSSEAIFTQPWILVTHMFLHSGFNHILFNMYGVFLFGSFLESKIGSKRILFIYFIGGIVVALLSVLLYPVIYGTPLFALGASAALLALIGTLIVIMPDLELLLFFFIPMKLWQAGILWALIDIIGVFIPNGIGNLAHLIGLACGLAYGYYLKKQRRTFHKSFKSKTFMNAQDVDEYLRSGRL